MKFTFSMGRDRWDMELESEAKVATVADLQRGIAERTGFGPGEFELIMRGRKLVKASDPVPTGSRIMVMVKKTAASDGRGGGAAGKGTDVEATSLLSAKEGAGGAGERDSSKAGGPAASMASAALVVPDGFHVVVTCGASRKFCVRCEPSQTFASLRDEIAKELSVRPKGVRILWKGRERGDEETLASAGVTQSGKKLMVLFTETHYEGLERVAAVEELKKELESAIRKVVSLRTQREKRLLDTEELLVEMAALDETAWRLEDNIKHCDESTIAPDRQEVQRQLVQLRDLIDVLRQM